MTSRQLNKHLQMGNQPKKSCGKVENVCQDYVIDNSQASNVVDDIAVAVRCGTVKSCSCTSCRVFARQWLWRRVAGSGQESYRLVQEPLPWEQWPDSTGAATYVQLGQLAHLNHLSTNWRTILIFFTACNIVICSLFLT